MVSSSSERGFSTTRRIETGERNRLSEQTTEMLTFVNLNMRSKTRKSALLWKDIEEAVYSTDRSSLDDVSILPPPEEEELEDVGSIIDPTPSDELNSLQDDDEPTMRILQGSPDTETDQTIQPIESPIVVLSYQNSEFVSPLIDSSFHSFIHDIN